MSYSLSDTVTSQNTWVFSETTYIWSFGARIKTQFMVQPQYRAAACSEIPYLVNLITHNSCRKFFLNSFSVTVAEGIFII